MRLSLRIGSAAVLILLAVVLFTRHYSPPGEVANFPWRFDTPSLRAAFRPQPAPAKGASRRKWGVGTAKTVALKYQTTPIEVPNEGIIVMGKLREEDTGWVSGELAE